jgi:hypothetical protein
MTLKAENLQNAFLFFLTQVGRNNKIKIPKSLSLKIIREQILFHKILFKLDKSKLLALVPDGHKLKKDTDKNH